MKKAKKIVVNVILICLLAQFYLFVRTEIGENIQYDREVIQDGWDITVRGEELEEHTLKDAFFPVTNKGDQVIFSTTLPDYKMSHPILQFKTYHSMILVTLDEEVIYQYGEELYQQGKMVGSGYFRIPLPEDYAGKRLSICLDVTEDNAFSSMAEISVEQSYFIIRNFLLNNIAEVLIGTFLFTFGMILALLILFIGKSEREYRMLFWISLFSMVVAVWILSNFSVLQLFCRNLNTMAYLEYLSLYFAPVAMLMFVYEAQDDKRTKTAVLILAGIMFLFDVITVFLNLYTTYHFSKVLTLFHCLGFLTIVLTTLSNLVSLKKQKNQSDRMILYGLGIMVLFLLVDMVRFNVDKYFRPKHINISNSILPVGVLIFVITMLASYVYRLVQVFYKNVEKQTLIQIAYTDALTNVNNRAMCEKVFQERDVHMPTTVINFDLNHFKEVNDKYGHSVGDELLVEFAGILKENYRKDGFVGRMGGDEFIVVLDNNRKEYVEKTLENLQKRIKKWNEKKQRDYSISAAYGYCSNQEGLDTCSLWDLYKISDKNMYENKEQGRSNFKNKYGGDALWANYQNYLTLEK